MISGTNEQLQQQFEYTLLKPDCHCWWFLKVQSGREDTLQEPYAITFCFKIGKKGFKGVHEEIPPEEASTLQIGSVAFPPGQYTSPQLHPCHRLFDQDEYQDSSPPSL